MFPDLLISLNADVGEGYGRYELGDDRALLRQIDSASLACGLHAGDPLIMARTVGWAAEHGVSIGAHPGYPDLWGFGRRPLPVSAAEVRACVLYQIGALQAIARGQGQRVTHVKPHGALNNQAHDDAALAQALALAVHAADPTLILVATALSHMVTAAQEAGLRVAHEAYADRRYDDSGHLLPRGHPQAVIRDPHEAAEHAVRMVRQQAVFSVNGLRLPTRIDTLCVHGDEPSALAVATQVRQALHDAGVRLRPLPEVVAP